MKKSIIAIIFICIISILSFLGYKSINNIYSSSNTNNTSSIDNVSNTNNANSTDNTNNTSSTENTSNTNSESSIDNTSNINSASSTNNESNINNASSINNTSSTNKNDKDAEVVNISIPIGEEVSIFTSPNNNSSIITKLTGIHKIQIIEKDRNWDYIKVDNIEGYIPSNLVNAFINDYKVKNLDNNRTSNAIIANYFGNWKVSNSVGHSIEGMTGNYPSMTGKNLKISSDLYEFNGICINNPYYYVKKFDARELFGQYGATGALENSNMLDVLFVSQQPLSTSEVNNLFPELGTTPIIILYNSKIYIFGGGKNNSEIYSTYFM